MKALPSVLADWSQATIDFHNLYDALRETMQNQQANALLRQQVGPVSQCSSSELERVHLEMILELERLIQTVNRPLDFSREESRTVAIRRLCAQTVRLQKQTKRVQRFLWLCSFSAS